jgi:hypothetical protein
VREAGLVSDELRSRERAHRLTLDARSELEAFLAGLRDPGRWERRFMALETEVYRVKRERRDTPTAVYRANDSTKDIA